MIQEHTQEVAAMKSGMAVKTARKYTRTNLLPSEMGKVRHWKTRKNVFEGVWEEIEGMMTLSPALEAKTIMEYLINKDSKKFDTTQLRTLQRIIKSWRASFGKGKEIIFSQRLEAGKQSQSDYTVMDSLGITIGGERFKHLLFHFMLPYSRWEHVNICYSESFESLSHGYEEAVWILGGVLVEHRTDNLTAATYHKEGKRYFSKDWQSFVKHYGVTPTRNNPGKGNENGSVEKSHDLFKKAIVQQLCLRGSKDFGDIDKYQEFLRKIEDSRNKRCMSKLVEERQKMLPLPNAKYYAPQIIDIVVSKFSTVRILKAIYSVPSRLIGYRLRAYASFTEIKLYYGSKLVQAMPRLAKGEESAINYRHIIGNLLRKPGAFANYYYKDSLFPSVVFRKAYDILQKQYPMNGNKHYLQVLNLAAIGNESEVANALEMLLQENIVPDAKQVKELVDSRSYKTPKVQVYTPVLDAYDSLLGGYHG